MVKLFFYILLVFSLIAIPKNSQPTDSLTTKQKELTSLKKEIAELEKEIAKKNKKEKEAFSVLQKYDRQTFLLGKIINQYRKEIKGKAELISTAETNVSKLTSEIERLQNNYAKYVNAVYRNNFKSNLAYIFDSESIAQALRRVFYLKKFSEQREKDLEKLLADKIELTNTKLLLEKDKKELAVLAENKIKEELILKKKSDERRQIISVLRKDKHELKIGLETKKKAEISIKSLIAKLIEEKNKKDEEERIRLKLERDKKIPAKSKINNLENSGAALDYPDKQKLSKDLNSFEQRRGKLIWPVNDGQIIRKFGENKHLILNTITLNYGVDIKVLKDLNVKAVVNGVVSAIEWIPGYGSIIILTHTDDYRTVYSHLEQILVREGEEVETGQIIATIGESIEGKVLHFEIWNSRTHQNPEIWLAKK